jgi:hypothetical protein
MPGSACYVIMLIAIPSGVSMYTALAEMGKWPKSTSEVAYVRIVFFGINVFATSGYELVVKTRNQLMQAE